MRDTWIAPASGLMTRRRRCPTVTQSSVGRHHGLATRCSAALAPHPGECLLEDSVPRARVPENLHDTPVHRRLGLVLVTCERLVCRLRHRFRHPSRCCPHDLDRLVGVQTAFTGMRNPHARPDPCQPLLSCNSDRQGLVDVLQSSRARYVVERRDGDARRCTDLRVQEAQVSSMQIGMADEPGRGEDLRQAPVLGIWILRPRREQPVAFSPARLRGPSRLILERARKPSARVISSW